MGYVTENLKDEYVVQNHEENKEYTFDKKVSVENTGKLDCFVRARIELSNSDLASIIQLSDDGSNFQNHSSYVPESWKKEADSYYYYKDKLNTGASVKLLEQVKVSYTSSVHVHPYDIIIYSETIQTIKASSDDGAEYESAKAAFAAIEADNSNEEEAMKIVHDPGKGDGELYMETVSKPNTDGSVVKIKNYNHQKLNYSFGEYGFDGWLEKNSGNILNA